MFDALITELAMLDTGNSTRQASEDARPSRRNAGSPTPLRRRHVLPSTNAPSQLDANLDVRIVLDLKAKARIGKPARIYMVMPRCRNRASPFSGRHKARCWPGACRGAASWCSRVRCQASGSKTLCMTGPRSGRLPGSGGLKRCLRQWCQATCIAGPRAFEWPVLSEGSR